QWFRFFRDRKRLGVVIGGALVGVVDGGKKLHAELHGVPSFFRSARVKVPACSDGDVVHYRATGSTVNRTESTSAHARASRLTACGRDLDSRSVVDTRKVARHVRRRPVRYQRDPQGMERGQSRAVVGECEGASTAAAAGGGLSVVVGQDPTAD